MSERPPKIRSTCDACQAAKLRCSRDKPRCRRCQSLNKECVYSVSRPLGRPRRTPAEEPRTDDAAQKLDNMSVRESSHDANSISGNVISPPSASPSLTTAHDDSCDSLLWVSSRTTDDQMNLGTGLGDFDTSMILDPVPELVRHTESSSTDLTASSWDTDSSMSTFQTSSHTIDSNHSSTIALDKSPTQQFDVASRSMKALGIPIPTPPLSLEGASMLLSPPNECETLPLLQSPFDSSLSNLTAPTSAPTDLSHIDSNNFEYGCNCYTTVLRRMHQFGLNQLKEDQSTIDDTMRLEKYVRSEIVNVLRCRTCPANRQRVLLFTAIILETIVDMLEHIFIDDTAASGQSFFDRLNSPSQTYRTKRTKALSPLPYGEKTTLKLGTYEIDGEEKAGFLSYMIRSRLKELSNTMRHLHNSIQQVRQSSNSKAATTIVVETYQRLQSLMRRLE